MNHSKLLIGILIGFAIGGGFTYFSYAEELEGLINEIPGFENGVVVRSSNTSVIESDYKDCSMYSFKELTMKEFTDLPDELKADYLLKEDQARQDRFQCERYNQDIAQNEQNKRVLEEKKSISRGF